MQTSNILFIESLDDNWRDKDEVMLHACFQLLQDCIDKEELFKHTEWESLDEVYRDLQELYKWWQTRKNINWTEIKNEEKQLEEDQKQLMRLIELRHYLWW